MIGLFTDIRIGRYRASVITCTMALVACMVIITGVTLTDIIPSNTYIGHAFLYVGIPVYLIMNRCFQIVTICLALDQLMDAPSSEISALIHWKYFLSILSWMADRVLVCALRQFQWNNLIYLMLHTLSLTVILITLRAGKKWLVIEPHTDNPFILVKKVLRYVITNKEMKNRSALTYWKDHYPSRIDLAKDKYGGPFTEEQVEDVKTLFALILINIAIFSFLVFTDNKNFSQHLSHHDINNSYECIFSGSDVWWSLFAILLTLALHQCLIFPICYKHWPSMLRKIGLGYLFFFLSTLFLLALDGTGHLLTPELSTTCILSSTFNSSSNQTQTLPLNSNLLIIHWVMNGVGFALINPTSLEFLVAQAPYTMKGVLVGLQYSFMGLYEVIGNTIHYPFQLLSNAKPSCEFYYFLTKVVLLLLLLALYCITARCYKLRQRQDIYNEYYTIEQHYDLEFQRRDEYLRTRYKQPSQGTKECTEPENLSGTNSYQ